MSKSATLGELLRLIKPGFAVKLVIEDALKFDLFDVRHAGADGERLWIRVASVQSIPHDYDAFEREIINVIRARFDPSYDACEVAF